MTNLNGALWRVREKANQIAQGADNADVLALDICLELDAVIESVPDKLDAQGELSTEAILAWQNAVFISSQIFKAITTKQKGDGDE